MLIIRHFLLIMYTVFGKHYGQVSKRFPRKSVFTLDEIKILLRFYPNFIEISMFRFLKFQFQCRNWNFYFGFDCLPLRNQNSDKISIWFCQNFDVEILISISISISTLEFQFWFWYLNFISDIGIPISKHLHWNM
jgi:hypothetical protein